MIFNVHLIILAPRVEPTLAVKFETAKLNFALVFVPATCPAFATLLKAPFSHAVPALTYLYQVKTELECYFFLVLIHLSKCIIKTKIKCQSIILL